MRKLLTIWFLCALAGFLMAEAIAIAFAGDKDQRAFIIWTMAFVIPGAVPFALCGRWTARRRLAWWVALLPAGAVAGVLWTFFVAATLGPWFGLFSMPVLLCWVAAGLMLALVGDACFRRPFRSSLLPAVCAFVALFVITTTLTPWIHDAAAQKHSLRVTWYRWYPSNDSLTIDNRFGNPLSPAMVQALKAAGVRGRLESQSGGIYGGAGRSETTVASVTIIMDHPLDHSVTMRQPDQCDVVFLQQGDQFRMIPSNAPLIHRTIVIEPIQQGRQTTGLAELPSGAHQGGGGILWDSLLKPFSTTQSVGQAPRACR